MTVIIQKTYDGDYSKNLRWNGKGKEYYGDGILIFEGDYLDGLKTGKCVEFKNDKIIFIGEYLLGERNGKGKEFSNDILIFEGEFLKGQRYNGKGIEKDKNFLFEGEYSKDIKMGK